jgi:hypothetical protein
MDLRLFEDPIDEDDFVYDVRVSPRARRIRVCVEADGRVEVVARRGRRGATPSARSRSCVRGSSAAAPTSTTSARASGVVPAPCPTSARS